MECDLRQNILVWELLTFAQLAFAYFKQALIARTDLLTYATLATHDGHSQKNMMIFSLVGES